MTTDDRLDKMDESIQLILKALALLAHDDRLEAIDAQLRKTLHRIDAIGLKLDGIDNRLEDSGHEPR